uniref:Leucine rich repeat containing 3B n=1 Tax=Lates calcarifer TaxID=8187 RepID=A0A4W6E420_LATCA
MTLLDVWLSRSIPMCLLLRALYSWPCASPRPACVPRAASASASHLHGTQCYLQSVRLKEIPPSLPVDTVLLRLDHNQIGAVPDQPSMALGEAAFSGIEGTLQVLDLPTTVFTSVHKDAFARLKARVIVDDNPWHCDCASSRLSGRPFLAVDTDLCNLAKRTTDYAMLVTMFGWFAMVISYVVYYVRQNQEDARRHLEYLKSLPSKPKKPDEADVLALLSDM